ncbi:putative RNA binding protein with dsRBD fold (UPF0201 family) [Microbacterium resistens]|uniref:RNA binding protein with dsRBD fold (UPF0201 family) n=1 Tax=Microbacterium resistens TaxID=156977 RepID=A0ABU1SD40_9MICO|nr:hypothetical protein [Microbacterium resistens]MDR6867523.1 putative RNA binding protein with dsRBD fold (UPF0201 family) [Microbacterium resistens]
MTDQIPPTPPAAPAAPSPAAPPATPAPATPASSTPPWGDDPSAFDPDKAWKLIENLRTDAEKRQEKTDAAIAAAAEKAQKDTLAQFAKLLSGEPEPETDPVKLAATIAEKDTALTTAQQEAKAGQVALQVAILGAPLGANIPLLLANESFKTAIASVEPTDQAAITAEITKALQVNAALKQPPARSGAGDHTGPTIQSLEAQLKAAEEKKDFKESIRLKRAIASARAAQA